MVYPIDASLGSYDTNSGLSGTYIPEIWSGKLIEKFYMATVFAAISNTDYEGEITAYGDKVIIRTVPDITIRDYEIGQSLKYEKPRSDNVELLIDQGKYYGVAINSVEKKQADIDYVSKWAEDASEQMKIEIDGDILSDVPSDASAYNVGATAGKISANIDLGAANTDGSDAEPLSKTTIVDKMVACGQVLTEQNVPQTNRWFVIPAWASTRIKTSELSEASYSGDGVSMKRNGRIGVIDTFEIFVSNNVLSTLEGSVTCYSSIFGHKSALTFASQLTENELIDNPDDFGKLMRGLQVYGYKVIKPESMGHLYCKPA
ncbi:hypothetical protein [Desulfobacula sp.]|uniref:hypothetical protein n=1 Tax=Desulfobacula sp. TaxID=2593537 RepID=UPI00261DCFA4|nr:hypothetical protein [Desulfobacula sp.]